MTIKYHIVSIVIFTIFISGFSNLFGHSQEVYSSLITRDQTIVGSGTESDPHQISNVDQLQEMNENLEAYYILTNDIDASSTKNWNGGSGFIPIGDSTDPFNGILNGKEYDINNLNINRPGEDNIGLFGYIGQGSNIFNLGIINTIANIKGNQNVGGIVGHNDGGSISNCYYSGMVTGSDYWVGGLVGSNDGGIIKNCYSIGSITGTDRIGGFTGLNENGGVITSSYSIGLVSGGAYVAGFVGRNLYGSNIYNCYSTSNVIGENHRVAGFVGLNYQSVIENCYSTGDVSGSLKVGGFVGLNDFGSLFKKFILNWICYRHSNTSGWFCRKTILVVR